MLLIVATGKGSPSSSTLISYHSKNSHRSSGWTIRIILKVFVLYCWIPITEIYAFMQFTRIPLQASEIRQISAPRCLAWTQGSCWATSSTRDAVQKERLLGLGFYRTPGSIKRRKNEGFMMKNRARSRNDDDNEKCDDGDQLNIRNNGSEKSQKEKVMKNTNPLNSKRPGNKESDSKLIQQSKKRKKSSNNSNFFSLLSNPYQAGKQLRQTLDSVLKPPISPEQRAIYYLDDRFLESASGNGNINTDISQGAIAFAQRNPLFDQIRMKDSNNDQDYIPEVLVIGATGSIGRQVVKRLLLTGRCRVRVLVRDLYSKTLNMLGAGVTYCQGDLRDIESLEYAVTDVDKIIFCAGPPGRDEDDFGNKFKDFAAENLGESLGEFRDQGRGETSIDDNYEIDLQKLSDTMEIRAKLAHQVDEIGMQNIVRAYQNVRHADYGTSQAAKRSLFKFQDREEDYNLFSIDASEEKLIQNLVSTGRNTKTDSLPSLDDKSTPKKELQKGLRSASVKAQVTWMKNKFSHGVFVGRIPAARNGIGSEASIISSRLRSRDDPEKGTDLSNGFSGFLCRICADGKTYQAFIRTSEYDSTGVEYVCKFQTEAKQSMDGNKSVNKFQTIRLPFSNFKPIFRQNNLKAMVDADHVIPFDGKDVKQIGFRVNSMDNALPGSDPKGTRHGYIGFYLAISYIKVYRAQPEPEFIYISDARIPPTIKNGMVRHDLKRILSDEECEGQSLFDEKEVKSILKDPKKRSGEELYYKYRGEEILKSSGLQYAIIRVPSLNELPSGEFSTIELRQVSSL
jgi:Predicted nucleoside-diphosphate-sugar epimerases